MPRSQPWAEAMKKSSRAGGKPAKVRRRSALKPKAGSAPKAMPRRGSSPAGEDKVARLTRERDEALGQQAATAEVLRVISNWPGKLDAAFETILANATRLCDANFGTLSLHEGGGLFRSVAMHNAPAAVVELRRRLPLMRPSGLARLAITKKSFQTLDAAKEIDKEADPDAAAFAEISCDRTAPWRVDDRRCLRRCAASSARVPHVPSPAPPRWWCSSTAPPLR